MIDKLLSYVLYLVMGLIGSIVIAIIIAAVYFCAKLVHGVVMFQNFTVSFVTIITIGMPVFGLLIVTGIKNVLKK